MAAIPARMTADCILECHNALGEGPLWSVRDQTLFWVDCIGKALFALRPDSGEVRRWALPGNPGSLALRAGGGLFIAYRAGLALFDPQTGRQEDLPTDPVDFAVERFNDGKVDRRGRFWAGTVDRAFAAPVGGLWRIGADHRPVEMDRGFVASNGIAWSPDDRLMYFCDSRPGTVYVYDFDSAAGTLANRRVFLAREAMTGRPDGCTVDAEGCLWVAEVDAGQIGRYAPDGRRLAVIEVPVNRPSSLCFAGPDLDTLYITSIRRDGVADEPLGGCLFAARPGVRGLPEPLYLG